MKKVLSALILLFCSAVAFSADVFEQGKEAFYKENYGLAQKFFLQELQNNSENYPCRYFLAHTYVYTGDTVKAKEEYSKIITFAPNKKLQKLAMQSLHNLNTQAQTAKTAEKISDENYFDNIKIANTYVRWREFPINVYVQPSDYSNLIKTAFSEWQKVSGGLVSFNFVSNINSAQITTIITRDTTLSQDGFRAGNAVIKAKNKTIYNAQIYILDINPKTGEILSPEIIYSTTLHEIGHALGLQGHSPDTNDIMASVNSQGKKSITKRDLNTLKLLYR